jgi:hypothetical protein
MGGQACVFYGAAEFSRDTDLAILASAENLGLLKAALRELRARRIAVPPFEIHYLLRGHAVHFRCYHPECLRMRIDVMSVMRGVDPFDKLWGRRTQLVSEDGTSFDVMSLPDLVRAKKTQRDKDWPMIRRLVEADYVGIEHPTMQQVRFWLTESRTPPMLIEMAKTYRVEADALASGRPLLRTALAQDEAALEVALYEEEKLERDVDRQYWEPLKAELGALRQSDLPAEEEI